MINILYNTTPIGLKQKDVIFLNSLGYNCMAIVAKSTIIKDILRSWIRILQDNSFSICLTADDETITKYRNILNENETETHPMKPRFFFLYHLGGMLSNISDFACLDSLIEDWGYLGMCEIIIHESKPLAVKNYFKDKLYSKDMSIMLNHIDNYELIIRESGDEDEVEIIFKKQYFDLLHKILLEILKENN